MRRPMYTASKRCDNINYHIISNPEETRLVVFQKIEGIEPEINILEEQLDPEAMTSPGRLMERVF